MVMITEHGPINEPSPERDFPTLSTIVLLVTNAVPLVGVIFLGWRVFPLLLLYWSENVIVGGFNVLRILVADPDQPLLWGAKLFMIPFFCVHFGMFTFVHGVFVLSLFGGDQYNVRGFPGPSTFLGAIRDTGIGYAVFGLVLSHTVSFIWNYLRSGEYKRVQLPVLMMQPYARVMILHFVVLGGGFAMAALHAPAAGVVLLVILKTTVDLLAHHKERAKFATRPVGQLGQEGAQ